MNMQRIACSVKETGRTARLWFWTCILVLSSAMPVHARQLLWVTADITPAGRTALVKRLGAEHGWTVQHLEHPLQDQPAQRDAQRANATLALARADLVWVDAPHATAVAKLDGLLGDLLQAHEQQHPGGVVWVGPEGGGLSSGQGEFAAKAAEYLRAGGERNTRAAMILAKAWHDAKGRAGWAEAKAVESLPAPQPWPLSGIYHPELPDFLSNAQALSSWQAQQAALKGLPSVAVLVHRHHFINGETQWLDRWLQLFRQQGLFAYAVFGQQLSADGLRDLLSMPSVDARPAAPHPRLLVLHQLTSQAQALQTLFQAWDVPVLTTQPYRHGDTATWKADATGLRLSDTPFYYVQPEATGAIDPMLVVAHADDGRVELIERQAQAVAAKARRLLALRITPAADKRVTAMVYNYPPGGSNFGASFLNVPRSLEAVSEALGQAGYSTRTVAEADWVAQLPPLLRAYYPDADLPALLANDQAAALPLSTYRHWWNAQAPEVRARIVERWGEPEQSRYVVQWKGESVFVIPRLQVGHLSVLPQPPREETLYFGQNPFMHRSRQPLSHHYLAVYLWARQADALIHFGTHGTQEWAPGKARGLDILDDALLPLGDVPVIYPYIVDNLGEALTAKRRGRALLLSHRTPVLATTGLSPDMGRLHELMHEWSIADEGAVKQTIGEQLVGLIVSERLHHDLKWPEAQVRADLDSFLEALHPWLDQLAHSSQPQGLAVFGRVPDEALRRQTVLQSLRTPLLDALGEDVDETFLMDQQQISDSRPMRWLQVALQDAEAASRLDLRAEAGTTSVPNRAAVHGIDAEALRDLAEQAQALDRKLAQEREMPALLAALEGRFVEAAYGGDPIRNPDSLPTGRNLTGLDPSRLPTPQAYAAAELMFEHWLSQWQAEHGGQMPQRLALSLWAGETLRHQGVMEAQALVALGVRPIWDASGRPRDIELIDTATLGRPRVDVLLSVTGSYRDQFAALMALIDTAVARVRTAEPDGVVSNHSKAVTDELIRQGLPAAQASLLGQARVFGNPVGDYGTGIDAAVQHNDLQVQDERLGELFLRRMSQPYLGGEPVDGVGEAQAAAALASQLRRTDAALLSRSSHLYGMVTSDDAFQYLGGLAAAARSAGREQPLPLYVNQLQNANEPHTQTAAQSVAVEMQARYHHPGWVRALKAEGYAGTLQVLKAVQHAWGWQSVTEGVVRPDQWQTFYEVLVQDRHKLAVPEWMRTHPQAYAQTIERLIQAQRHGHWTPDAATQRVLAELYQDLTESAPLAQELTVVREWVDQQMGGIATSDDSEPLRPSETAPLDQAPQIVSAQPEVTPEPGAVSPDTAPNVVTVRGQLLERQDSFSTSSDGFPWALIVMGGLFVGGSLRQWRRGITATSV